MSKVAALRLVEEPPYFERELPHSRAIDGRSKDLVDGEEHSLHSIVAASTGINPRSAAFFINTYSKLGDILADPFCGRGVVGLEAALAGRLALCSDANPLGARYAQALLTPADITEVTLKLQCLNLTRPFDSKIFGEYFAPFYDLNTFRELVNLRKFLNSEDKALRFIEVVASSLLHGPSAGYFSVYSPNQLALSPKEQLNLNKKRHQVPDYRSVVPRILRKTASVLRDGIPSVLERCGAKSTVRIADARQLKFIENGRVDLIITSPPLPKYDGSGSNGVGYSGIDNLWLKLWFSGIRADSFSGTVFQGHSLNEWADFIDSTLIELARISKPGSRAVLELRDYQFNGDTVCLAEIVSQLVRSSPERLWDPEGIYLEPLRVTAIRQYSRSQESARPKYLVLRRKW